MPSTPFKLLPLDQARPDCMPDYLVKTYRWAYLDRRTLPWLDRNLVVSAILWGNAGRLIQDSIAEFSPGDHIMQAACVYGDFSRRLLDRITLSGSLAVVDVASIQLDNLHCKLGKPANLTLHRADLGNGGKGFGVNEFDGICCFFLLHEIPETVRIKVVEGLLANVRVGGKIVFTDYHRPSRWHPLRPIMAAIFRRLEPYAISLLHSEIETIPANTQNFSWSKRTYFGGLYQKVVATRLI